jgi:hypothetical protein
MSSRLHNKFHRHNHHTTSTNDTRYPDAAYDPIASYAVPFNGPFVVQSPNPGQSAPTSQSTTNVAIDAGGDIVATGDLRIAGQYFGDGSQLAGINVTSIVGLSGSPFSYGNTNPITSTVPSLTGLNNLANAPYSIVTAGSSNQVQGNANFSFIAAGSANITNVGNTFILGSNITASLPNYTYVNNLSSIGNLYSTTINASSVNAKLLGDGSLINLSTNPLSSTTTTLVNTVSTTLNVAITSLSASYVSNTVLQSLSGKWQNVYSLVNTTTATTFNVNNLTATGFVNAVSANLGTTSTTATLNVSPLSITGAANGSIFNQIQNTVAGVSASTDISLYNNDGVNYLDLGIASTTYNGNIYTPTFNVVGAGDSYVYATNGNLVQGAAASTGNLTFFTGGTLSANERMRITNTGNVGIGTTIPNQNLTVVGNISATGNVYGNISIGTSIGYEVSANSGAFTTTYVPFFSGTNFSDFLVANAKYEIVYNTFVNSTYPSGVSYYYTISADSNFALASLLSINSIGIQSNGTTNTCGSAVALTNVISTPAIGGSTANNPNNSLITTYIKTGNTPINIALFIKTNTQTGQTLAGSYRKVTRIA